MLDLVKPVLLAQGLRFSFAQPVSVGAEPVDQLGTVTVGRGYQGLRQGGRHFAADGGVGHAVEHGQTPKMPCDVPGPQKACEKFFKGEFHRATPAPPALTLIGAYAGGLNLEQSFMV